MSVQSDEFRTAARVRIARSLQDSLEDRVLPEMKRRTGVNGDFFKFPSGDTSESLKIEEVDPENTRGWRFETSADTPGAFFTNLGIVIRPVQARILKWKGSNGKYYSKHSVDMRPYKNWLREMAVEVLRDR